MEINARNTAGNHPTKQPKNSAGIIITDNLLPASSSSSPSPSHYVLNKQQQQQQHHPNIVIEGEYMYNSGGGRGSGKKHASHHPNRTHHNTPPSSVASALRCALPNLFNRFNSSRRVGCGGVSCGRSAVVILLSSITFVLVFSALLFNGGAADEPNAVAAVAVVSLSGRRGTDQSIHHHASSGGLSQKSEISGGNQRDIIEGSSSSNEDSRPSFNAGDDHVDDTLEQHEDGVYDDFNDHLKRIDKRLACFAKGRDDVTGVNYYFDQRHGGGECAPLPTRQIAVGHPYDPPRRGQSSSSSSSSSASSSASLHSYRPPPDPTIVTMLDSIDKLFAGNDDHSRNEDAESERKEEGLSSSPVFGEKDRDVDGVDNTNTNAKSNIITVYAMKGISVKHVPSIHGRWYFNDWRLWEAELCPFFSAPSAHDSTGDALPVRSESGGENLNVASGNAKHKDGHRGDLSSLLERFVSSGDHKNHTLNQIYELTTFCLDEEDGTLFGFELYNDTRPFAIPSSLPSSSLSLPLQSSATAASVVVIKPMNISMPQGATEHSKEAFFFPNNRMFSEANQVKVRIVAAPLDPLQNRATADNGDDNSDAEAFKRVVKASLDSYFREKDHHRQQSSASSDFPPEVMFVDRPALIHPLNAGDEDNPDHTFFRIAAATGLKHALKAESIVFTTESVSHAPATGGTYCSAACRYPNLFAIADNENKKLFVSSGLNSNDVYDDVSIDSIVIRETGDSTSFPPLPHSMAALLALPRYLLSPLELAFVVGHYDNFTTVFSSLSSPSGPSKEASEKGNHAAFSSRSPSPSPSLGQWSALVAAHKDTHYLRRPQLADLIDVLKKMDALKKIRSDHEGPPLQQQEALARLSKRAESLYWSLSLSIHALSYSSASSSSLIHSGHQPSTNTNTILSIPMELFSLNTRGATEQRLPTKHFVNIVDAAALEAAELHSGRQVFRTQYSTLLSTGSDGCEAFRCMREEEVKSRLKAECRSSFSSSPSASSSLLNQSSSSSSSSSFLALYKRCATPYIVLPVSDKNITSGFINVTELLDAYWEEHYNRSTSASGGDDHQKDAVNEKAKREADEGRKAMALLHSFIMSQQQQNEEEQQQDREDTSKLVSEENNKSIINSNDHFHYTADTAGYSRHVWNNAVRALHRESKRIRRDIIRERKAMKGKGGGTDATEEKSPHSLSSSSQHLLEIEDDIAKLMNHDDLPRELTEIVLRHSSPSSPLSISAYILVWRKRLIDLIAGDEEGYETKTSFHALSRASAGISTTNFSSSRLQTKAQQQKVIAAMMEKIRMPSRQDAFSEYFNELFAIMLETMHSEELTMRRSHSSRRSIIPSSQPTTTSTLTPPALLNNKKETININKNKKKQRRQQLMCFRKAYVLHIRLARSTGLQQVFNYEGVLNCMAPANCHTRELMQRVYATAWQRYGMCLRTGDGDDGKGNPDVQSSSTFVSKETTKKAEETTPREPHRDSNRDAHPVFTLPPAEKDFLRALFSESTRNINTILADAKKVIEESFLASASASSSQRLKNDEKGKMEAEKKAKAAAAEQERRAARRLRRQQEAEKNQFERIWLGARGRGILHAAEAIKQHDLEHSRRRRDAINEKAAAGIAAAANDDDDDPPPIDFGDEVIGDPSLFFAGKAHRKLAMRREAMVSAEMAKKKFDPFSHDNAFDDLDDAESAFLSSAPNTEGIIKPLIERIEATQRAYDDYFMQYFVSSSSGGGGGGGGVGKGRTPGRPIRIYQPHRSKKRAWAHFRSLFGVLSPSLKTSTTNTTTSIYDMVDFQFTESARADAYTLTVPPPSTSKTAPSSSSSFFNTPRAHQFNSVLTTDIAFGTHGAEMHNFAFLKPSAFATELGMTSLDVCGEGEGCTTFNSGFFAPLAFARQIGYYRVFIHRVYTYPDPIAERDVKSPYGGIFGGQMVTSLTDLRQAYSLTICSWLAMNSVRLADEEKERQEKERSASSPDGRSSNSSFSSFDFRFLVPWWCRGGSSGLVREFLHDVMTDLVTATNNKREQTTAGGGGGGAIASAPLPSLQNSVSSSNDVRRDSHHHFTFFDRTSLSARAVVRPSYFTTRMVPTPYGLVEPFCPPLTMRSQWAATLPADVTARINNEHINEGTEYKNDKNNNAADNNRLFVEPAHVTRATLVEMQRQCAVGLTLGTHGSAVFRGHHTSEMGEYGREEEALRLRIEGLQGLLESVFGSGGWGGGGRGAAEVGNNNGDGVSRGGGGGADPLLCQLAARLILNGSSVDNVKGVLLDAGMRDVDDDNAKPSAGTAAGSAFISPSPLSYFQSEGNKALEKIRSLNLLNAEAAKEAEREEEEKRKKAEAKAHLSLESDVVDSRVTDMQSLITMTFNAIIARPFRFVWYYLRYGWLMFLQSMRTFDAMKNFIPKYTIDEESIREVVLGGKGDATREARDRLRHEEMLRQRRFRIFSSTANDCGGEQPLPLSFVPFSVSPDAAEDDMALFVRACLASMLEVLFSPPPSQRIVEVGVGVRPMVSVASAVVMAGEGKDDGERSTRESGGEHPNNGVLPPPPKSKRRIKTVDGVSSSSSSSIMTVPAPIASKRFEAMVDASREAWMVDYVMEGGANEGGWEQRKGVGHLTTATHQKLESIVNATSGISDVSDATTTTAAREARLNEMLRVLKEVIEAQQSQKMTKNKIVQQAKGGGANGQNVSRVFELRKRQLLKRLAQKEKMEKKERRTRVQQQKHPEGKKRPSIRLTPISESMLIALNIPHLYSSASSHLIHNDDGSATMPPRGGTRSSSSSPPLLQSSHSSPFTIACPALRHRVIAWIVTEFMRVEGRPTFLRGAVPMMGREFPYGSNCSRWPPRYVRPIPYLE